MMKRGLHVSSLTPYLAEQSEDAVNGLDHRMLVECGGELREEL